MSKREHAGHRFSWHWLSICCTGQPVQQLSVSLPEGQHLAASPWASTSHLWQHTRPVCKACRGQHVGKVLQGMGPPEGVGG